MPSRRAGYGDLNLTQGCGDCLCLEAVATALRQIQVAVPGPAAGHGTPSCSSTQGSRGRLQGEAAPAAAARATVIAQQC